MITRISGQTAFGATGLLVSLVGVYIGIATATDLPPFSSSSAADSLLELVNAEIAGNRLDLTVRNVGADVAVLTQAEINLEEVWVFDPTSWSPPLPPTGLPPSAAYSVDLDTDEVPAVFPVRISQEVEAGRADRFTIDLHIGVDRPQLQVIGLSGRLLYDGDKSLTMPLLLLSDIDPISGPYPVFDFTSAAQKEMAQDILETRALKDAGVETLVEDILAAPDTQ